MVSGFRIRPSIVQAQKRQNRLTNNDSQDEEYDQHEVEESIFDILDFLLIHIYQSNVVGLPLIQHVHSLIQVRSDEFFPIQEGFNVVAFLEGHAGWMKFTYYQLVRIGYVFALISKNYVISI